MRLSIQNDEDRKFLEKLKDPKTGKSQLDLQVEHERKRFKSNHDTSPPLEKPKKSKIRNITFDKDGVHWDSKWEYECWLILKDLERRGIIFDLGRQKTFRFIHNGIKIFSTRLDFTFRLLPDLEPLVADAKSEITNKFQRFRWQHNAMKAFYGIDVIVFIKNKTNVEKLILNLKSNLK